MPQSFFAGILCLVGLTLSACAPDLDQLESQRREASRRKVETEKNTEKPSANLRHKVISIAGHWRLDKIISNRTDSAMKEFKDAFNTPNAQFIFKFEETNKTHQVTIHYSTPTCKATISLQYTYCCPGMHRLLFDKGTTPTLNTSPSGCTSLDYLWNQAKPQALDFNYHFAHDTIDNNSWVDDPNDATIWPLLSLEGPYEDPSKMENEMLPRSTTFLKFIRVP